MSHKKVLSLLHTYFNRAGTEKHARTLARAVMPEVETTFVAVEKGFVQQIDLDNKILNSMPAPSLAFPQTPLEDSGYELIFQDILKTLKPDLVHVHHLMNWPLSVLKIINQNKIPWILSLHDYYLITPHFTMQGITDTRVTTHPSYAQKVFGSDISAYLIARREYLKNILPSAKKIIAPSKFMKRSFQSVFSLEVQIIEHQIGMDSEALSQLNSLPKSENAFGFFGSFLPQKGISVLTEAYQKYRQAGGSWELHLFGGQMENHLQGITAHGVYDESDLPKISAKFSVGIIPSVFPETFCLTLSEMWALNKPVIASSIGALGQRIQNNPDSGWLFSAADSDDLCKTMLEVEQAYSNGTTKVGKIINTESYSSQLSGWGGKYYG